VSGGDGNPVVRKQCLETLENRVAEKSEENEE
jgi:hypothetical protein